MNTIEERANVVLAQHTNQPTAIDLYSKDEVLKMLVEIATEQKSIDIYKACEWLWQHIGEYVNEQGFVETHELDKDFRKAMEREQ